MVAHVGDKDRPAAGYLRIIARFWPPPFKLCPPPPLPPCCRLRATTVLPPPPCNLCNPHPPFLRPLLQIASSSLMPANAREAPSLAAQVGRVQSVGQVQSVGRVRSVGGVDEAFGFEGLVIHGCVNPKAITWLPGTETQAFSSPSTYSSRISAHMHHTCGEGQHRVTRVCRGEVQGLPGAARCRPGRRGGGGQYRVFTTLDGGSAHRHPFFPS